MTKKYIKFSEICKDETYKNIKSFFSPENLEDGFEKMSEICKEMGFSFDDIFPKKRKK